MRSIFAEHGIPSKLITDNELQYNCREFRQFKEAHGLQHRISPVSSVERICRAHGTDREEYTTMKKRGPVFRNTVKQNNTSCLPIKVTLRVTQQQKIPTLLSNRKKNPPHRY